MSKLVSKLVLVAFAASVFIQWAEAGVEIEELAPGECQLAQD
jgi:hypothetical protein